MLCYINTNNFRGPKTNKVRSILGQIHAKEMQYDVHSQLRNFLLLFELKFEGPPHNPKNLEERKLIREND